MKTIIFVAVLGFALTGCAGTGNQADVAHSFEDSYTPTGSHIARKTVERSNGVQTVNKEEFQRTMEMSNPSPVSTGR
ncbi:membrane lipoprotein lipid attachment site-containing protein [Massilia sp. MB5]|uniref:membrane lipoprotein lipid attachment site-containing protein n=1 Tax=unclassified Massilia TaxID=2609279 RepID=UPI00067D1D96|nr:MULTISPECIES: membrane lipoprotein lipid attachment site-containing protein [unclassified Massilia]AKU21802.1 hypothetical protein ACZ75_10315 [Massilia sp. NR 4-1]UMR28573.1 membrane lipoprotein lipid attachment site-containing protein [Massilia sp. MB5]